MPERLLRLDQRGGLFRHDPRIGLSRLVQVNMLEARCLRIPISRYHSSNAMPPARGRLPGLSGIFVCHR